MRRSTGAVAHGATSSRDWATRNIVGFAEGRGEDLHADGQAAGAGAERHAHPGSPDRFDGIVYVSHRYMASGLSVLSPIGKATVGDAGVSSTSACS